MCQVSLSFKVSICFLTYEMRKLDWITYRNINMLLLCNFYDLEENTIYTRSPGNGRVHGLKKDSMNIESSL